MRSLRRAGYDVVAVNPRESEIDGEPCYPTRRRRRGGDRPGRHRRRLPPRRTCASSTRARPSRSARAACGSSWASRTRRPAGSPTRPGCRSSWTGARSWSTAAWVPAEATVAAYWPDPARRVDRRPRATGGPDAADPPPRRARRLRPGRAAARRSEPGDAHRRPLRRRPGGQPAGDARTAACSATRARSTASRCRSRPR